MPVNGARREFHQKTRFRVLVGGFSSADFTTMSELASEFGTVEHREGGQIGSNKDAGLLSFDDVTLTRGVVNGDSDAYNWFNSVGNAVANSGLTPTAYKRTVTVQQLDRTGVPVAIWRLDNAFPKRFVAGDWDNNSDEVTIAQLVLSIENFAKIL